MIAIKRMNYKVTRNEISQSRVTRHENNKYLIFPYISMAETFRQKNLNQPLEKNRSNCRISQVLHGFDSYCLRSVLSIPSSNNTNYLVFHGP